MKKSLMMIMLVKYLYSGAGEIPKQIFLVNLPDLAQQKLSISFLNRTKQNNFWQFDAAYRQVYTYSDYFPGYGSGEPHDVKAFSSPMGFHIFSGVGYKFISTSVSNQLKKRYWQPTLVLKMAEEKMVNRRISLMEYTFTAEERKVYNRYYSAGFELNNGRLKQGKKLMTDVYWGIGFKINYLQNRMFNYLNHSPDFFYHATPINYSRQWSFSPYINLGIKFGK